MIGVEIVSWVIILFVIGYQTQTIKRLRRDNRDWEQLYDKSEWLRWEAIKECMKMKIPADDV